MDSGMMRHSETSTFMLAAGFRSAITYLITSGHREHSLSWLGESSGQVGPETTPSGTRERARNNAYNLGFNYEDRTRGR